MNKLGKNLKYLRKLKGLRQAEMMNQLGFLRTTWSNYENAISEPSIDGLISIANFFGISVEKLILSDLEVSSEQVKGKVVSKKAGENAQYLPHEEFPFTANEAGLTHIMNELNRLKKEVNLLKSRRKNGR